MKTIVPYSKEIKFETKISEIVSMSLEHELNIKDEEVLGDFVISGEYKTHEISVNKEKFLYRLPFSVDLTEDIIKDSLEFNIEDFYYDLIGDDTLKVNIEFSVNAEEKEKEEVLPIEEPELEPIEIPVIEEEIEERVEADEVMESIKNDDDTYITYHVHIIRENETIETICTMYNTDIDTIKQYNSTDSLSLGDKLVIPNVINE